METQARYTIVGMFTLAVVAAGFAFAYWLHSFADVGALAIYSIRFEAPVIGLRPGVAVLFNGMRVGEVTSVRFDALIPKLLLATIAVEATTPVRRDTAVGIDSEGLIGGASVSLTGGVSTQPLKPGADGKPPTLIASAAETQSLPHAAKATLALFDGIMGDDAKPLAEAIASLGTFSAALARNSGRVDGILAGLEKMTGGGPAQPPPISYNLTAPDFSASEPLPGNSQALQLALPLPTALVAFETQKVLVAPAANELKPLEEGQWADSIPQLVQVKIVVSLENAGFTHVGKAMDGFTPEAQLLLEIRAFEIVLSTPPSAHIEIHAKWLGADGRIGAERSFAATAPAAAINGPAAAAALSDAFQIVARDVVGWARTKP